MDLTLLAVLAAAIFLYRAPDLMQVSNIIYSYDHFPQCEDSVSVQSILVEGARLKVLPLLQFFLFNETEP
jgi:hypothetical protein